MKQIKVGAVSYLNTKPLIYGFQHGHMKDELQLIEAYPSRIATMLLDNEIDLGLVPVAIIPRMATAHIIGDYCISSDGPVASVCLFSDVPIQEVKEVLLDYQSRTSVELARILLRDYWKLNPVITDAKEDFREHIKGTTAGLVIGDRAFEQKKKSAYSYDLGEAWKQFTGLPFVFAAWISNKPLDEAFIDSFNSVTGMGLAHIDKVIEENPYTLFDLKKYFTQYINYNLDENKRKGLQLFLDTLTGR